ncbi:MAG: site-specific integrase [Caulobacteraceae bacterium]
MSNVRKVTHASGLVSWRATWLTPAGARQSKNFTKKGDAQAYLRRQDSGLSGGSASMTVAELATDHLAFFDDLVRKGVRERVTLDGYATALDLHVKADSAFAKTKLADLTTPLVQAFLDRLFARASVNVTKKTRGALILWCEHGQRRGLLVNNPAKPTKVETTKRTEDDEDRCEIPPKDQLKALLAAAAEGPTPERDAAVVRLLMFGGLRISELLGLSDTAANSARVRILERLDSRYKRLGKVKSARARRDVPIGPATAKAVKLWRVRRGVASTFLHYGEREDGRLFPQPEGAGVWGYHEFRQDLWIPLMERAGLLERVKDDKEVSRPVGAFGPHVLRHVAASLWIAQGLTAKRVQELLGHSSIRLTMDLYGHLWEDTDGDAALAAASERLVSG